MVGADAVLRHARQGEHQGGDAGEEVDAALRGVTVLDAVGEDGTGRRADVLGHDIGKRRAEPTVADVGGELLLGKGGGEDAAEVVVELGGGVVLLDVGELM